MKRNMKRILNGPSPAPTARKFWNMVSRADDDSAEITLYGDVMAMEPRDFWTGEKIDDLFIAPNSFMNDLAAIRDKKEVVVKINSCGGDIYTGIAIHNALKGLKGHKTVVVEGIAASAASVIACAGDDVQVYPGSLIMIHGVSAMFGYQMMNIAQMKLEMKGMEAAEQAMAAIYNAKTGMDTEKLRSLMEKETWMVGQQAVEKGFANTVLGTENEPSVSVSADRKTLLVASISHDVHAFHNLPNSIPIQKIVNAAPVTAGDKNKNKEVTHMTEQELRAQYPDLVASIEQQAAATARTEGAKAERERLQAIESIEAQIGDRTLLNDAKYGANACDAAQLAFRAMQAQAKQGQQFLDNLQKDANASNAQKVAAAPNGGNPDDTAGKPNLSALVQTYNAMKTGGK